MVICPDCGKEVPNAKFCKNCGARLPDVEEVEPVSVDVEEVVPVSVKVDDVGESVEEVVPVSVDVDESVPEETAVHQRYGEDNAEDSASKSNENGNRIKFCRNCGTELNGNPKFCPNCGYDLQNFQVRTTNTNVVTPKGEKNIILSILLSVIFPGLGQIYLGLDKKGSMFLIGYVISLILILLIIGFILCFVIWIWALVDVIQSTNALNRGESVEDKLF